MSEWRDRELPIESAEMRPGEAAYIIKVSVPIMPGHNFQSKGDDILACPFKFQRVRVDENDDGAVQVLAVSVGAEWVKSVDAGLVLGPGQVLAVWVKNFSDRPRVFKGRIVGMERLP